jgi:hypothetical protein
VDNNQLNVEINSPDFCNAFVELYSINGVALKSEPLHIQKGKQTYQISVNYMHTGVYMLRVITDSDIIVNKFSVE